MFLKPHSFPIISTSRKRIFLPKHHKPHAIGAIRFSHPWTPPRANRKTNPHVDPVHGHAKEERRPCSLDRREVQVGKPERGRRQRLDKGAGAVGFGVVGVSSA
jgi:hypothetical protein